MEAGNAALPRMARQRARRISGMSTDVSDSADMAARPAPLARATALLQTVNCVGMFPWPARAIYGAHAQ